MNYLGVSSHEHSNQFANDENVDGQLLFLVPDAFQSTTFELKQHILRNSFVLRRRDRPRHTTNGGEMTFQMESGMNSSIHE
jgi:hypothetical protein